MRRALALVVAVVAAGCGPKQPRAKAARPASRADAAAPRGRFEKNAPDFELGELSGRVFVKDPPALAARKPDKDVAACAGATTDESIVSEGGGLGNVVVTLVGAGRMHQGEGTNAALSIDQHGCQFVPHVTRAWAGQPVQVSNSDAVMHNIHSYQGQGDDQDTLGNIAQPAGTPPVELDPGQGVVTLTCDVHGWMRGYVVFSNDPGVVTPPSGTFRLAGLAPGHYTVETWHERLGTRRHEVDVRAGQATELEVDY